MEQFLNIRACRFSSLLNELIYPGTHRLTGELRFKLTHQAAELKLVSVLSTPNPTLPVAILISLVVFRDRVALCIPGWDGAYCVAQAGLELKFSHLSGQNAGITGAAAIPGF